MIIGAFGGNAAGFIVYGPSKLPLSEKMRRNKTQLALKILNPRRPYKNIEENSSRDLLACLYKAVEKPTARECAKYTHA